MNMPSPIPKTNIYKRYAINNEIFNISFVNKLFNMNFYRDISIIFLFKIDTGWHKRFLTNFKYKFNKML